MSTPTSARTDTLGSGPRILFVIASLEMGGVERHATTLLPALMALGGSYEIVTLKREGALFQQAVTSGVPTHSLAVGESSIRALVRLWRHVRRVRPDVIMTAGFAGDLLGRLVGVLAQVPVRITWKHNCGHLGLNGLKERIAERLLGRATTRYLAVCNSQLPYLVDVVRLDPSKIRVVHNSVDVSDGLSVRTTMRASLGLGADDFVITCVAVMRAEKDHESLLRAFQSVVSQEPTARLVLVGDGPLRENLRVLAHELGVVTNVIFAGQRTDARDIVSCSDLVVLVSFTIECFPYAILEAMEASRPVVCTAVGGLPEMVDDGVTGYLVPARSPGQVARRILDVIQSPDGGAEMGRSGRARLHECFGFHASVAKAQAEVEDTLR